MKQSEWFSLPWVLVGLFSGGVWKRKKNKTTTGVLAWVLEGLVFESPMCNILIIYPVSRALGIPTSIHRGNNKHGEIVRLCHYGASCYIKTIIELYVLRVPIINPMWFNLLPLFNLNVVSRNYSKVGDAQRRKSQ